MTMDDDRQSNRQRLIVMALVAVPLIAFFTVLGIALTRSGGVPAGVAINSTFGEADVDVTAARDFTLTTFDGDEVRLSDLRGSYVMVDFWSSWCPPCREEAPTSPRPTTATAHRASSSWASPSGTSMRRPPASSRRAAQPTPPAQIPAE